MRLWGPVAGALSLGLAAGVNALSGAEPQANPAIRALLEKVRDKYHLPALAGAIVDGTGLTAMSVVGVRKSGDATAAKVSDSWHLGSDTKAMTATMIAALVEQGKLSWDSTLGSVFTQLPAPVRDITLLQLLSHRAGLPANTEWRSLSNTGSLVEQRWAAVAKLGSVKLLSAPGSTFSYSNWGYVVAGAMAEQATGKSYEELMGSIVFRPLQMESAGYGPPAALGKLDGPWGHTPEGEPNQVDNPLLMAPAGCVHCSLEDWGRFISDQLRGSEGKPALLRPESYTRLHSAPFGGDYALGWGVRERSWGAGRVFTHTGSNTMNLAVVWMAPARDFAVLVVCNQGKTDQACDDVAAGLISIRGL